MYTVRYSYLYTRTHVHVCMYDMYRYMYVQVGMYVHVIHDTHTYNTSKVLMYPPLQYITNKYIYRYLYIVLNYKY